MWRQLLVFFERGGIRCLVVGTYAESATMEGDVPTTGGGVALVWGEEATSLPVDRWRGRSGDLLIFVMRTILMCA